ncbi:MAG TPA: phospholipid carrier-dependent glycosyltransferase, partial [Acidobacteriaceae bacterium]|nr:phospholipid carrier-dependent glycosyltransferase [Acidobacteriaceae bacterium]
IPLALSVLALAFCVEAFARRAFRSTHAGLYAALVLLSSPGIFLFTRILLPDAMLCLWIALALYCFWLAEQRLEKSESTSWLCYGFAACCALGVLTKGFIGVVFPAGIVVLYLLLSRGLRGAVHRLLRLHPFSSTGIFFLLAAPWHLLAAWQNPTRGYPGSVTFTLHPALGASHFFVPLPTQSNVHGWAWFYFINEQVLRYLNARVPRDYDTVPLWLFWGLCLLWLMPWSAFIFHAISRALSVLSADCRQRLRMHALDECERSQLLLLIWALTPLIFFSFSTRQEYYVLPSLPPLGVLVAGWLAFRAPTKGEAEVHRRTNLRCTAAVLAFGTIFAIAAVYFVIHSRTPAPNTDLASLLSQNPGDYALSMGHFLDLDARALALFRLPLLLAAAGLFLGPLASYLLRRRARPHAATLALAAGAFGFLLAAHLGLQTFAPVLSSAQLAKSIASQVQPGDLIVIHQEYEFGSTLGFYLQRPAYAFTDMGRTPVDPIHILTEPKYHGTRDYGRSSNLWYGSFFPDAPAIFETERSLAAKWRGPQRVFLWQDLGDQPAPLPKLPGPVYILARSGGKEIVSNQPNH